MKGSIQIILFVLLVTQSFSLLSQKDDIEFVHQAIDKEQNRLDGIDMIVDGQILMRTPDKTQLAGKVFIDRVDSIQDLIRAASLTDFTTKNYLRNLEFTLQMVTVRNYTNLNYYDRLFTHLQKGVQAIEHYQVEDFLKRNVATSLQTIGYFQFEIGCQQFLEYASYHEPQLVFKQYKKIKDQPWAQKLAEHAALIAPMTAKQYLGSTSAIYSALKSSTSPDVKVLFKTYNKLGFKTNAFLLLDPLAKGRISYDEADSICADERILYNYLISLRSRDDILGAYSVDQQLNYMSLDVVRVINDMHEIKDPKIRFKSVEDRSPEELYTLMVYTQEEIFTSTFMGFFSRMLERLGDIPGDQFLASLGENQFRVFIKLCAGYNTLNEFLGTMSLEARKALLVKYISDLEKFEGDLSAAVDVADSFGSIEDSATLAILEETLISEFDRVTEEGHQAGIAIYGLLACLFEDKAMNHQTWFADVRQQFQIPDLGTISNDILFDANEEHVQVHYFYDDKDGYASYNTFVSYFKPASWKFTELDEYVIIQSRSGKSVSIYANKPEYELTAHALMNDALADSGIYPQVIVHRGHSYYAPKTIEFIQPSTEIVLLGSCGGYHSLTGILNRSPDVHIISSKQIGTMLVNNPLLLQLGTEISLGNDIYWPEFWSELESKIISNSKAFGNFQDYIPPHKNLGAIFIRAYNELLESGNG